MKQDLKKREQYLNLLSEVASMYYERDMIQSEIAKEMCISRTRISRLLKEAREEGIVQFSVQRIGHRSTELEEIFKRTFRLGDVVVINDVRTDPPNARIVRSEVAAANGFNHLTILGSYAAEYFESVIEPKMTIGMSWGRSVTETVRHLHRQPDLAVNIIQVLGGVLASGSSVAQMDVIIQMIHKYKSRGYLLPAPLFIEDRAAHDHIINQPTIAATLELGRCSDILLTGVGDLSKESFAFMWQSFGQEEWVRSLMDLGGVGFLCGQCYDQDGNVLQDPFNDHIVAVELERLKQIPLVIAVAGGEEKGQAVLGALRGGYINTLITDRSCAVRVLELNRKGNE